MSWSCSAVTLLPDGSRGAAVNCGNLTSILALTGANVTVPAGSLDADVAYAITLTVSKADGRSASTTQTMQTFASQTVLPTGTVRYDLCPPPASL